MLDIELIGRVKDIEKRVREEMSCQALNFDLDSDEIIYNMRKLIDLLDTLNNYSMDTIVLGKLNATRNTYEIIKLEMGGKLI